MPRPIPLREYYKTHDVWNKGKHLPEWLKQKIGLAKRGLINQPQPCACGCGQLTKPGNKFIHGHNLRVENPVDKLEVRRKISKTWFKEGEHASIKTEFKNGNTPWWIEKGLSSPLADPKIRNNVFPSKDTSIEVMLKEALKERKIPFEAQYPVIGQPDIAFPNEGVAVFCDGCYWHCCPVCNKDLNPHYKKGRDESVTRELESMGWIVLRFWEHEIMSQKGECIDVIEEVLNR